MTAGRTSRSDPAGSPTILIVDDDQDIREIVGEILSAAGYGVVFACNGADALEALKGVKPSLILLDLNMPVMDGLAFRRAQMADVAVATIPTVVMSAVHQLGTQLAGLHVDEALAKPITFAQLMAAVERHCR